MNKKPKPPKSSKSLKLPKSPKPPKSLSIPKLRKPSSTKKVLIKSKVQETSRLRPKIDSNTVSEAHEISTLEAVERQLFNSLVKLDIPICESIDYEVIKSHDSRLKLNYYTYLLKYGLRESIYTLIRSRTALKKDFGVVDSLASFIETHLKKLTPATWNRTRESFLDAVDAFKEEIENLNKNDIRYYTTCFYLAKDLTGYVGYFVKTLVSKAIAARKAS